jgi:hypothetical protein
MRVNDRYRIIFAFRDGDAYDVTGRRRSKMLMMPQAGSEPKMSRVIGGGLGVLAIVLSISSHAHAGDLSRDQRLRISGWTMVGVGAVMVGTGIGVMASADCGGPLGCIDDNEMVRQNTGLVTLSLGLAAGAAIGMPMLIRARKLKQREAASSGDPPGLQLGIGPGSVMVRGRF